MIIGDSWLLKSKLDICGIVSKAHEILKTSRKPRKTVGRMGETGDLHNVVEADSGGVPTGENGVAVSRGRNYRDYSNTHWQVSKKWSAHAVES